MLDPRRLPIFINPENTDIEIEAGIFEIVRIAAVKSHLLLWRENYPDVVVTFVTIKMIEPALIKRNDIGSHARVDFAFLFDLRNCIRRCIACPSSPHAGLYAWPYVRG